MSYTIYYHDDFDGTTSSAVLLYAFKQLGLKIKKFIPIVYTPELKANWVQKIFPEPFGILDFIYHPKAELWFDHHNDPFLLKKWREQFKESEFMKWDIKSSSCCSLVFRYFSNKFSVKFPNDFKVLAKEADIIDGALYKSAEDILKFKNPFRKFSLAISNCEDSKMRHDIQKVLIENLGIVLESKILKIPIIKKAVRTGIKIRMEKLNYYKKYTLVKGNTSFIDIKNPNLSRWHMAPYYLYPKLLYSVSIGIEKKNNKIYYHIGAGHNVWSKKKSKIHLGELMKKYGGGGHKGVGATQTTTYDKALKIANEIIDYLNKNG